MPVPCDNNCRPHLDRTTAAPSCFLPAEPPWSITRGSSAAAAGVAECESLPCPSMTMPLSSWTRYGYILPLALVSPLYRSHHAQSSSASHHCPPLPFPSGPLPAPSRSQAPYLISLSLPSSLPAPPFPYLLLHPSHPSPLPSLAPPIVRPWVADHPSNIAIPPLLGGVEALLDQALQHLTPALVRAA